MSATVYRHFPLSRSALRSVSHYSQLATNRSPLRASHIGKRILKLDELSGADELGDAAVEVDGGLEALFADLLVGDLVVALIGVVADLGEMEIEVDVLEDLAGHVFLGEVHGLVAHVVNLVLDFAPPLEREDERASHVADVDEGPLESALVDDQVAVLDRLVGEVVGHQVQAHPVADTKGGGESVGDAVARVEHHLFGRTLGFAIKGDRGSWRLLVADIVRY